VGIKFQKKKKAPEMGSWLRQAFHNLRRKKEIVVGRSELTTLRWRQKPGGGNEEGNHGCISRGRNADSVKDLNQGTKGGRKQKGLPINKRFQAEGRVGKKRFENKLRVGSFAGPPRKFRGKDDTTYAMRATGNNGKHKLGSSLLRGRQRKSQPCIFGQEMQVW